MPYRAVFLVIRRVGGLEAFAGNSFPQHLVIRRVGGLEVRDVLAAWLAAVIRRVGGLEGRGRLGPGRAWLSAE